MSDTSHRLLQPAPLPPRRGAPGPPGPSRALVKKPGPTTAPCETCRQHKIKCDGRRPVCTPCETRNRQCNFTRAPTETPNVALKRKYTQLEEEANSLRSKTAALNELMTMIRSKEAGDAASIFDRIRLGDDPEAILRSVRDADLLLQLQVAPEARFRFVFPFQRTMPLYLQTFARPYLSSLLFEATAELVGAEQQQTPPAPSKEHTHPQFFKPYHAASIVDPRLDAIKPSLWTNVCQDDNLMRMLIRLYYQHEYLFLTCFHIGAFLDDMLSGTDVSALHFLSMPFWHMPVYEAPPSCLTCVHASLLMSFQHCHLQFQSRLEHWNPENLGHNFLAEAKKQFDEQVVNNRNSVTLVQAAMVINITLNMHSLDKLGTTITLHAVEVAHNLGLFESPPGNRSQICQRVYAFTAWNLYWWTSVECYHFFQDPWIRDPPKIPLPDPSDDPTWYGETWVQYPSSPTPIRVNHGSVCKGRGELAMIINSLAARLYKNKHTPTSSNAFSIDTVLEFASRLQDWFSSLPACLSAAEIVFPSQLELHQTYHNLMVNVCEISAIDKDEPSKSEARQRISSMLTHSRACFEALVRMYYLRHGYEYANTYLTHHLTVLAFAAVGQLGSEESVASRTAPTIEDARSALILAAKGLYDQPKTTTRPWQYSI